MSDNTNLSIRRASHEVPPQHYSALRSYLRESCGILLGDDQQSLVRARLSRLLRQQAIDNIGELVQRLRGTVNTELREQLVDALTTDDSQWFRDSWPFEYLTRQALARLQRVPGGSVRIWSAGCAQGQEPYSISMLVDEEQGDLPHGERKRVEIIATDRSSAALQYAAFGQYDHASVLPGLSNERLQQHFKQTGDGWVVKPEIRQRVYFQLHNLLDSYSYLGMFDIIFCRNTLLYFSEALKIDILKRMHAVLKSGGYLILGDTETLPPLRDYYTVENCNPGVVYRAL